LFLLIVIPLAFMYHGHMFNTMALTHVTFTINLISPKDIIPGVYWYFGLTMQFYIIYLLFYYRREAAWVWAVGLLSIVLVVLLEWKNDLYLYNIRHNSPGWLMVFLFGVWYARGGHDSRFMRLANKHRLASIGLFVALWIFTSLNTQLWVLSPFFSILAMLLIVQKSPSQGRTSETAESSSTMLGQVRRYSIRTVAYLGTISVGIFVWHPILRMHAYHILEKGADIRLLTLVYLLATILIAAIFTPLYKKLVDWTFSALRLK
jgi:peptidoglycan/LPS O-acetylase OafA/YrhL